MKKNKAVIALLVLGLLFAGLFLWEHLDEKHQEELIQAAQDTQLGEGVTLRQGLQAYFGDLGDWNVIGNDDTIYLDAGHFDEQSDGHFLSATFQVNEKTGQLDILTFIYDFQELSQDEIYDLIDAMIQAAKR